MAIRKQLNTILPLTLMAVFTLPEVVRAQSTILATPNLPDIFATLESSSNFFSHFLLFLSLGALFISPVANLIHFIPIIFVSRAKKYWGVIFNSATKQKTPGAVVGLYKKNGQSFYLVQRCKSDSDGKYGFDVNSGEYKLTVTLKSYSFPSKLYKKTTNLKYPKPYFGDKFVITSDNKNPSINIPIDPLYDHQPSFQTKLYYYSKKLLVPLILIGTTFALYSVYFFPTKPSLIIVGLYSIAWFVIVIDLYFSTRGLRIISEESSIPVENAIVEFSSENTKQKYSAITDQTGKLNPKLPSGYYSITVHRPNYNSRKFKVYYRSNTPLEQITIKI